VPVHTYAHAHKHISDMKGSAVDLVVGSCALHLVSIDVSI
jgi:hypothetical protein